MFRQWLETVHECTYTNKHNFLPINVAVVNNSVRKSLRWKEMMFHPAMQNGKD